MEQPKQELPIEEMALVAFQKDIQAANLMKALKEANQKIQFLEGQLNTNTKPKVDSTVRVQSEKKG